MAYNDIYDRNGNRTGKVHPRGTPWRAGEYGLVVCVWVYDGKGNLLLTRRAQGKSFAGTWENSGGAAQAGEDSRQAIVRELYEETGILAAAEDFELLTQTRDRNMFYDHYCLFAPVPLTKVRLQRGETDAIKWASFEEIREMIRSREICDIIAAQFLHEEKALRERQNIQE